MTEKIITAFCVTCQQDKPISVFKRNAKSARGLVYSCRECSTARPRPSKGSKLCLKCGYVKVMSLFYSEKGSKDSKSANCKQCIAAQRKTEQGRLVRLRTYDKHKDNRNAECRAYKARVFGVPEGKAHRRAARIKYHYGLTPSQFETMRIAQNDRCAICRRVAFTTKPLCVDHDHETGKVRGLLCAPCNTILGRWNDNPAVCESARMYLLNNGQSFIPLD